MKINDKEITVKKLKRKDVKGQLINLTGEQVQDKLLSLATGLKLEELDDLDLSDYFKLSNEFNQVNEIVEGFQVSQVNETQS